MFSELVGTMVSAIEHVGSTSVPGFAALERLAPLLQARQYALPKFRRKPSSIPRPLRAALHRVDQEIQHMLENTRLLAKAA
jgi:hypothetical protein